MIDEGSILECLPTEERIMTDERGDFTVGASHGDTFIDTACEKRNPIFKIVMGDLHDVWSVCEHTKQK